MESATTRSKLPNTPWRWDTLGENPLCMGCTGCVAACPFDALATVEDRLGYYRPEINIDACTECGLCVRMCPAIVLPKKPSAEMPTVYAFVGNDKEEVRKSTSGGIFPLLAREIIQQNGKVAGVAWTKDFKAESILISSEEDILLLQKSKYVQPQVGDLFRRIREELRQGTTVLFSGLPCQCAGLRAFLHKRYENLFIVDILCGMAPSQAFFTSYLDENWGIENISDYEFRYKDAEHKWHEHYSKITFTNGRTQINNRWFDPYQLVYHDHTMCPFHCESCRYQEVPRYGDISIGDFWGISQHDDSIPTDQGVSVILVNTPKGQNLLDQVTCEGYSYLREETTDSVGPNGFAFDGHGFASLHRDVFYREFWASKSFTKAYNAVNWSAHPETRPNQMVTAGRQTSSKSLFFDSLSTSPHADPMVWVIEWNDGGVDLSVLSGMSERGNHAAFQLDVPLSPSKQYLLQINGYVKTLHSEVNIHLRNSQTGAVQVIHRFVVPTDEVTDLEELVFFHPDKEGLDELTFASVHLQGDMSLLHLTSFRIDELLEQAEPSI